MLKKIQLVKINYNERFVFLQNSEIISCENLNFYINTLLFYKITSKLKTVLEWSTCMCFWKTIFAADIIVFLDIMCF